MKKEPKYPFPVIHLNGSHPEVLLEQYQKALDTLQDFRESFIKIDFHPRDYYPKGDSYWLAAYNLKNEMRKKLNEIEDWLQEHAIYISESTTK